METMEEAFVLGMGISVEAGSAYPAWDWASAKVTVVVRSTRRILKRLGDEAGVADVWCQI